jgi:S1-C subfamily serine protease
VGGPLITFTDGKIAGFEDQNEDGSIDSFKTTANINPGNSGGLAINSKGEQIGIPTYGVSEGASKIDRIKMVNIALPYLNQAIKGGGSQVTLDTPAPSSGGDTPGDTPAPATSGVILSGRIIDANTKRGVPGALLIILQPGVTYKQFQSSGFDEKLVATIGTADRNGKYQTSPEIERGQSYTVVVGAKGYTPRTFENGLEVANDDPDVTNIEDIPIKKQ